MADKGYTKTYHHLIDATFWNDGKPYDDRSAYIDLLLRMNYTEKTFRPANSRETIIVHENEIFTSIGKLGKRWMWSENKVRRYLRMMEKLNFLRATAYTSGTLITLINTDKNEDERRACGSTDGRTYERTHGRTDERTGGRRLNKDIDIDKTTPKKDKNTAKRLVRVWEE